MKRVNRIIAIMLSVVMLFSVMTITDIGTTTVKAEEVFTITSPTAGSLNAAGYIDIKWTDASTEGAISNYKVYVDGALVGTTTSTTYEYYTTKVNYHTVWVEAYYTNGYKASTSSVRFGVSKKGLGLATDMGSNLDLKDMGVAWYYNWGVSPSTGNQYSGIEFVPMQWGNSSYSTINTRMNDWASKGYKYVLAYNEPDLKGQGVTSVSEAVTNWPAFQNHGIRVGSPASYMWPSASSWLKSFMTKINNNVDFVTIHCYPENHQGAAMAEWFLEEVVDQAWEMYHKPIWITEFSTIGSYVTTEGTKGFWEAVMPELDKREYVVRYAGFSFNASREQGAGLWYYTTGALTEGGEVYKAKGNPTTDYVAGSIKNIGATQKGNLVKVTVTPTVKKPAKAKIKSLKNVKKKKIKVSIKKIKGAKGYQIRWSDSKKFDGYWQKTIKKTNYTIKGLDKNTRYYVRVRAYKMNGKKKLYGKWSNKKSVKVKK